MKVSQSSDSAGNNFSCWAKHRSFQIFILAERTENFWDINQYNFAFYVITIHNVKW